MLKYPHCPRDRIVKNGRIHNGKQRFRCQDCGRQFVEQPTKKIVDSDTRALIDRLLLERLSLAGIAPAAQVPEQWIEQGRDVRVSIQLLEGIARALKLNLDERNHLFLLADRSHPIDKGS